MQLTMQSKQNFVALLSIPFSGGTVLDREFDEDENRKPVTAEPLDWELSRHWPALATD